MSITNHISAKTVYCTLLHENLEDLEKKIDVESTDRDLWVSIYNSALAVKQNEVINNGGTY